MKQLIKVEDFMKDQKTFKRVYRKGKGRAVNMESVLSSNPSLLPI